MKHIELVERATRGLGKSRLVVVELAEQVGERLAFEQPSIQHVPGHVQ